jgi:ribosomal protein S27AE
MRTAKLLDCKSLEPGSLIDVETTSRHYRIECLGGSTIRISGNPRICPTPVLAQLQGSVTSDGTFDDGLIECGMRLAFLIGEHHVSTSKVLSFQLDQTNPPACRERLLPSMAPRTVCGRCGLVEFCLVYPATLDNTNTSRVSIPSVRSGAQ